MFVSDKNMKDLILSYLRNEETSISGLSRSLQKDGYKVHRLVLTGYLKAMADMGVLRQKEIPPSKVYTLTTGSERNIYEVVGDKCKSFVNLQSVNKSCLNFFKVPPDMTRQVIIYSGNLQRSLAIIDDFKMLSGDLSFNTP